MKSHPVESAAAHLRHDCSDAARPCPPPPNRVGEMQMRDAEVVRSSAAAAAASVDSTGEDVNITLFNYLNG